MIELVTHIDIEASAERVWALLTDFGAYKDWNPLLTRAKARPAQVGVRVPMWVAAPFGPPLPMSMQLLTVAQNRELMWVGKAPLLLRGEHWFRIEPREGGVRLHHGERFSGLLPSLLGQRFIALLKPSYEALNLAIKARAERG